MIPPGHTAPEVLPRTLVDTTIQQLVRLLPAPLRRASANSWGDHLGNFITSLAHIPQILEKSPVFLWGKLPRHDSFVLLLKLDYPKTEYFYSGPRIRPSTLLFTTVLELPCKESLPTASFDPALGRLHGTLISSPAWASTVAAAIRVTPIPPTNGSTRTLLIS